MKGAHATRMPPLTAAEYYAHHYPYEKLVKLLTRHGDKLSDCEFAIEGKTDTGDKLYRRYVSVRGPSELRDAVSRFPGVKAFHFGAFYSNGSSKEAVKLKGESVPVRRVLSFDIDLTDLEFLTLKDAEGNDVPGDLLRRKTLEDYFLFLSRHPGRNVETSVAASSQPGGVSLDFLVMENKPLSLFVELSNTGTQQEGYFRQRYGLFHSQLTGNDDTLSLEYMTSDFDRSNAFFGKYESPFADNERMQWSIAGDWSQFVADEFGVLNDAFSGDSWSITGNITANIHQDGAFFLDLVGGLRIQNVAVENNLLNTNGSEDFLIPFVMLEADHLGDWSNFTGSLGLEFNVLGHDQDDLVTLGRFDPADYWARMNWSFAYWTFLEPLLNPSGWNDPSTPETSTLAHELMLYFGGQFAFNSRLLPQFQYVMGGMYSVRGYPQSVAAGDTGMVGKIEYRYHLPRAFAVNPEPIELFGSKFRAAPQHVYGRPDWDLMLCTFLDVGVTEQSHPLFFEDNDTLVGTGVGLEFIYRQNLRFRLDWGFPLKDMESAGVKVGDERLYVSGSIIF